MFIALIAAVLALCVLPVKLGASVVGAKRAEWPACLLSVVAASLACGLLWYSLRIHLPLWAVVVVSMLLTAAVHMLVLGTTYPRGVAVALIQYGATLLLVTVLASTPVGPMLRHAAAASHSLWPR